MGYPMLLLSSLGLAFFLSNKTPWFPSPCSYCIGFHTGWVVFLVNFRELNVDTALFALASALSNYAVTATFDYLERGD